ncbi:hypothetical protein ACJRO7_016665 [Eucalyptus globulus]|uniref:Bifunctional inhibitor/plant lipid transfer protein/seed storage helical domain-containing protein n=1 Tax=Eucalyptus globulus TaxID=34317 RepID=A0ABD3LHV2_EUCGL
MGNDCRVAIFMLLSIMMALATGFIREASAAGECGRIPIRSGFAMLSPCLGAARDPQAKVPPPCCVKVSALVGAGPRCLCAVLLSPAAKEVRIIPAAAISIPKRCHMRKARSECSAAENTVPSATKAEISPSP